MPARHIAPATGTLGVLLPGMGAVASTFIAGVLAARKGLKPPIGSLSQMAHIRLGSREAQRNPRIREFVPLAGLDDIVFGGWDPLTVNALEACRTAGVLEAADLAPIADELEAIVPMPAVFDRRWVSRLEGVRVKALASKWDQALALVDDIAAFKAQHGCDRLVMVWCGSTEAYQEPSAVHQSLAAFELGLRDNDTNISPSQNLRVRITDERRAVCQRRAEPVGGPAVHDRGVADLRRANRRQGLQDRSDVDEDAAGSGHQARMLGLRGWYSTNILGNRDGEVLDDPENFKSKEVSKLGVLDTILQPAVYPDLYGNIDHVVRINYYPPRGDNKEGWDNIDIFGWLGYPMQIKVDFLCRDSILAARSSSTSRCSSTSRSAPGRQASRSGSAST